MGPICQDFLILLSLSRPHHSFIPNPLPVEPAATAVAGGELPCRPRHDGGKLQRTARYPIGLPTCVWTDQSDTTTAAFSPASPHSRMAYSTWRQRAPRPASS